MTTATVKAPPADRAQVERAAAFATKLLEGHWHGKRLAVAAIGRVLAVTPPASQHGQLLARALRQAPGDRQRPDDERAVFWLAARGETPTAAAVTVRLEALEARRVRTERLHAAAAPFVDADGGRAAAYVAEVVSGTGPTWAELGQAMGWPRCPWGLQAAVIERLARAGWLQAGKKPRSLRPGPKVGGPERVLAALETS